MDTSWLWAIGTGCSVLVAGGGFVGVWNSFTNKITANKLTAEAAHNNVTAAMMRIDRLNEEMANQREITARNIGKLEANHDGLAQAIKEMTSQLRHVVERLDRFVDRLSSENMQESA